MTDRKPRAKRRLPLKKGKNGTGTPVEKIDRRNARQGKIDKKAEQIFLQKIYEGCTTGPACQAIGVSRQAIYKHSEKHPEFGVLWAEAIELGRQERADKVVDVMWERAVEGYQETEVRQWKAPNGRTRTATKVVKKVDNTLLLALAKSLMPEHFRDNVRVEKQLDVSEALADLMDRASQSPNNSIGSLIKD